MVRLIVESQAVLAKGANRMGFLSKLLTAIKRNEKLGKLADKVLALEEETALLTDEEIRNKTKKFQEELAEIEDVKNKMII